MAKQQKPFKRFSEYMAKLHAILALPAHEQIAPLNELGPYVSRGHGKDVPFLKRVAGKVVDRTNYTPKNGYLQGANGIIVDSVERAKWNDVVSARKQAQKARQAANRALGVRLYQSGA